MSVDYLSCFPCLVSLCYKSRQIFAICVLLFLSVAVAANGSCGFAAAVVVVVVVVVVVAAVDIDVWLPRLSADGLAPSALRSSSIA